MTKLIPIEDHILIDPSEAEVTSKSGIVLTDANKAVGEGRILENGQRSAMDVKEGDIVHFTKYAPDEIEV
jgi:chaperonin GroES